MKNFLSTPLLLIIIAVLLLNCKGDKGNPGPQGIQGEKGDSGPSASSYNFSLTFSSSSKSKIYAGIPAWSENDAVLVYTLYETIGGVNFWTMLPYTFGTDYMVVPEVSQSAGIIKITLEDPNGDYPFPSSQTMSFKAVVIKGMSGAKMSNKIDYKNYNEVKGYYGLKD